MTSPISGGSIALGSGASFSSDRCSHGKAWTIWRAIHSADGCSVTLKCTTRRLSCADPRQLELSPAKVLIDADHEVLDVVVQEGSPRLGRLLLPLRHQPSDGPLGDLDAELEELAVNARRSPGRVGTIHGDDKGSDFGVDFRPPRSSMVRLPRPVSAETLPMPADHRLGFDDHRALDHCFQTLLRVTQKRRSPAVRWGRCRFLLRIASCCLRARFSRARSRLGFKAEVAAVRSVPRNLCITR